MERTVVNKEPQIETSESDAVVVESLPKEGWETPTLTKLLAIKSQKGGVVADGATSFS